MTGNLIYIVSPEQVRQAPAQSGARKYEGEVATGYDAKREQAPKWAAEQEIIENMLTGLPYGDWVLDAPCGTGRFFEFYQRHGLIVRGLDISDDMIAQATKKVKPENVNRFSFAKADIRKTGLKDKSVDASVMCRLTRWLSPEDCGLAFAELQRVTRKKIIFTARVRNHPHARTYEMIDSWLKGWNIHRDEAGAEEDYRIIELRPE